MAIDTTARVLTIRDTIISTINTDAKTFSGTVTGATNASPIVITTSAAHGLADWQDAVIASVGGNTAANGTWAIRVLSSTTFSLLDSTGNAAYTSGGTYSVDRFTAKANYYPEYRRAQLKALQVDVVLINEETDVDDRQGRPGSEDFYNLEIHILKESAKEDTTRLDALVNLSKRIAKLFPVNLSLSGLTPEVVVDANTHELFDPIMLRDHEVFFSRIELSLREYVNN